MFSIVSGAVFPLHRAFIHIKIMDIHSDASERRRSPSQGDAMRMRALIGRMSFAALLVFGSFVVTCAPVQAQRWEDCRERIDRAQERLDRAIYRFGRHSDAARDARYDLERTREWCWRHNRDRWDRGWHDHH